VPVRVGVFGASRVELTGDDGESGWVEAGARKPRSIVAALVLEPGRPLDAGRLADLVWAGEPPKAPHGALHAYISRLRRVLAAGVLETTDHGYLLRVDPADVDVHAFAADVRRVSTALAPLAGQLGGDAGAWPGRAEVTAHVEALESALASWTGRPYADLGDHPDVDAERAALDQLRLSAEQTRVLGLLSLGEHAGLLSVTESAVAAHPLQERWWGLHALALTRAGRQADALAALRQVRDLLADELGLDPGPELQTLVQAILRQAPELQRTLEAAAPERAAPVVASHTAPSTGVGRAAEQAALAELVGRVAGGQSGTALLVGEPGIGKSWLLERVASYAGDRGFLVGRGRCSQDDGAPPLWPWLQVLRDLGGGTSLADLVQPESPGESAARLAFETSDRIAEALLSAASGQPVLVVLDDLHWADEATLRTLRHVLDVLPADARLLVVGTRRSHPEPSGASALVAEAFARRHSLRLDLAGLDSGDAAELARSVSPRHVTTAETAAWHRRSGGNPFFVVELARLGDTGDDVPVSVREVVGRRFEGLPARAVDTLRYAAALGRWFRAEVLATAAARDVDEVLDDLEVARSVGLVEEDESGEFAFAHALTRDAVLRTVPPNRRARLHAELARVLESDAEVRRWYDDAELTADLALQWMAAGPSHSDRAWPAARAAADLSHSLSAYRDSMDLRRAAVEAHRRAAGPDETERYALLLELAREASYAAQWPAVVDASFEAMALARTLGSPERVAEAAAAITTYTVWTPHDWMEVFEDAIDDLRWALATLPEEDSVARCRLLLALAVELYYDVGAVAERRALVEAGLALARRLGEPDVVWWATRAAYIASWAPSFTEARIGWSEEGLAAAREAGDRAAEAVTLVCLANDHLELGRMEEWERLSAEAAALATQERLPYVIFTLRWVESTLEALRGHPEERDVRIAQVASVAQDVAVPSIELMVPAMAVVARMWEPELSQYVESLRMMAAMSPMSRATMHALLGRAAGPDAVRESLEQQPYTEPLELWQSVMTACCEAEAASLVGDVALARRYRDILALYPERNALAGVAVVVGPVAGYLALADAALGDLASAAAYADLALALADERGFPPNRDWLLAHRARLGF
jgi:DNA-binding SARP family transcriptional activator